MSQSSVTHYSPRKDEQMYQFADQCSALYQQTVGEPFCGEALVLNPASGCVKLKHRDSGVGTHTEAVFATIRLLSFCVHKYSLDSVVVYLHLYKQILCFFDALQSEASTFSQVRKIVRRRNECIEKLKQLIHKAKRQPLFFEDAATIAGIEYYFAKIKPEHSVDLYAALMQETHRFSRENCEPDCQTGRKRKRACQK